MANETKVVITAQTAQAESAFRTLNGSLDGVSKKIFELQGLAATLGVALSVTAFAATIKSAIDLQDNLSKLAQKTGTSVEALAGLKFAADQNGASLESVANAAKKLATNLAENPDLFKKFGITAKDSTGALVQMADIFASMPDGVEKVALAVKLMGKSGEEMIPFLNQGGAALAKMVNQGQKLYPITAKSAKAAEEFNDQLSLLQAQSATLGISIANDLLTPLNNILKAMQDTAAESGKLQAIWVGLGAAGTAIFTDDMLTREQQVVKRLQDIDDQINNRKARWSFKETLQEEAVGLQVELNKLVELRKEQERLNKEKLKSAQDANKSKGASLLKALAPAAKKENTFDPEGDFWFAVEEAREKNRKKAQENPEKTGMEAVISLERDYQNELAKRADALNAPLLSASERKLADEMRNLSKRAQDSRVDLEKLHTAGTLSLENYQARLEEVTSQEEQQRIAIAALAAEQDKLNASWEYGARVALRNYLDEIENVALQSEQLFATAFKGMEDALVQFVKTGKLDFSSLADSIISDLLRISLRQQILGPLAGLLGGLGGGGGIPATSGIGPGTPNYTALGAAFTGTERFANGGIFNQPTAFKYANGGMFNLGIMGEAGPEAVMPLKRDSAGRLGVQASGGGSVVYSPVINIDSRTDQAEVYRLTRRAVEAGQEQLLDKLRRQRQIV